MAPSVKIHPKIGAVLVAILVIFAVVYVLVVRFYNAEGGIAINGGMDETFNADLVVNIEPLSVDAVGDSATLRLTFTSPSGSLLDEDGRLTRGVRVSISTSDGPDEFVFPSGTVFGRADVEIGMDGQVANYPFDEHDALVGIYIERYETNLNGDKVFDGGEPFGLTATGGVNGWNTSVTLPTTTSDGALFAVSFDRAFSNQLFAIVLILLGTVLSLLALIVGIRVFTGHQRLETVLLAWTASLLFALPLLRSYLPNSPPIGAAIDIYIYLWVIIMAMLAAVLIIISTIMKRSTKSESDGIHGP
jgi:hypothetical protein